MRAIITLAVLIGTVGAACALLVIVTVGAAAACAVTVTVGAAAGLAVFAPADPIATPMSSKTRPPTEPSTMLRTRRRLAPMHQQVGFAFLVGHRRLSVAATLAALS